MKGRKNITEHHKVEKTGKSGENKDKETELHRRTGTNFFLAIRMLLKHGRFNLVCN